MIFFIKQKTFNSPERFASGGYPKLYTHDLNISLSHWGKLRSSHTGEKMGTATWCPRPVYHHTSAWSRVDILVMLPVDWWLLLFLTTETNELQTPNKDFILVFAVLHCSDLSLSLHKPTVSVERLNGKCQILEVCYSKHQTSRCRIHQEKTRQLDHRHTYQYILIQITYSINQNWGIES